MELIVMLVMLALLIGAVVGLVWLIRRLTGGAKGTRIHELEARVQELERRQR
ncbi:hypothetical protein [Deinococcus saxicola]|uniref:hypothetical protein n=1 Tax=Deinococcus saxicola TaxID=249406 RepID=UPI0039EF0105